MATAAATASTRIRDGGWAVITEVAGGEQGGAKNHYSDVEHSKRAELKDKLAGIAIQVCVSDCDEMIEADPRQVGCYWILSIFFLTFSSLDDEDHDDDDGSPQHRILKNIRENTADDEPSKLLPPHGQTLHIPSLQHHQQQQQQQILQSRSYSSDSSSNINITILQRRGGGGEPHHTQHTHTHTQSGGLLLRQKRGGGLPPSQSTAAEVDFHFWLLSLVVRFNRQISPAL
ncbi:hypothetical protein ElyMa_002538100 [Elysia marginata]|uniref:Uncharacterized protein n=1 Tax=Elysia marginata TaxID=1093978 RepID=A0AAV4GUZ1_9GAST|nr:hypothetical protein ElyMa_002538100 [Elysia marginata]